MSEPMPLQPGAEPDDAPSGAPLVQHEGVNAGSDRSTAQSPATAADLEMRDVLGSVGSVEGAARKPDPRTDRTGPSGTSSGEELAGAPDTVPTAPGQYAAESGQDSGSIS
jgi:hypothetical protein